MDIIYKLLSLRLGSEEHTIVAEAMDEIERLREALRNIADKTVCSYAKITATVALINWQEPADLQQNGSE